MDAVLVSADTVRFLGIGIEHIIFARLEESVDHLVSILNVHIVVADPMSDKESTFELVCEIDRRAIMVSIGVVFRMVDIALGVNSVVKPPVSDRRDRGTCTKYVLSLIHI